ncbi:MAG TPA: acyl-CoA-binding protein [Pseudomonadales bacterium]|nr:acyl-CoA-binding protein [Pseudomonadales bacterium]
MGKLKDLVQDETLAERLTDRANRVRLAGLGLIKRVERESTKLFDELVEAGQGDVADNRLFHKIDAARRGALVRMRDEAKKLFDELVELGEEASKGGSSASAAYTSAPEAAAAPVKPVAASAPVVEAAPAASEAVAEPEDPELDAAFKSAKARIKTLRSAPDAATLANLYALYKQATEGDVSGKRPGLTEPVERAKFDARKKLKGISFAEAKRQYIELVDSLVGATA